jgi:hypothetical protein
MAFSITRPSSPQIPTSTPVDDHLSAALHAALSRVHDDMVHQDRSHHPPPDKSRIDIVLDSDVLALKGTAVDIEPALLSGHVVLTLSEATSIKEINLQFRGKTRVPPPPHEPYVLSFMSTFFFDRKIHLEFPSTLLGRHTVSAHMIGPSLKARNATLTP